MIASMRICQIIILGLLSISVLSSPVRADLVKDCDSDNDELSLKACSELIRRNPKNAKAHYNSGVSYQNLGRHAEAVESYTRAIGVNPNHRDYYYNRATAHDQVGDLDRAIDDFNAALKLRPNDRDTLGPRAWARARANKELKEALADSNLLVKLDVKKGAPFVTRSLVHFRMGQWQSAIADADAALKLYAKNEDALYIRGVAKIAAGNEKDGNEDLAAARAIDADVTNYFAKYGIK